MKRIILPILTLLFVFSSCDDTTGGVGTSLTDLNDNIEVTASTFNATSESVIVESILSHSTTGYLGKIKDAETGAYITSNFMTQFHTLDDYEFPAADSIVSKDIATGKIKADSCEVRIFYSTFYGDSLASMKCTLHEFDHPLEEGKKYYTTFNPIESGYIREGGIHKQKTYAINDYTITNKDRWNNIPNIRIKLDDPYTDKNGNVHSNYGTYVMQKFYENKKNFHNSYNFINNVCPGFYVESTAGIGNIAYVSLTQLNVYFRYTTKITDKDKGGLKDTIYNGVASFVGTEEVLQKTNVNQSKAELEKLANDNSCTYLKTPAGILTRISLPVDDIIKGHELDTLNSASITLLRENNKKTGSYSLPAAQTLLILPADSIDSFFDQGKVADYRSSFIASYSSTTNSYSFGNIASLIRYLSDARDKYLTLHPEMTMQEFEKQHPNWNKAIVVPVNTSYANISNTSVLARVTHDMSLTSTRLYGGKDNPKAIKINVTYSKFNK